MKRKKSDGGRERWSEGRIDRENGPPVELILVEGVMVLDPAPVCRCSGQPTMTP